MKRFLLPSLPDRDGRISLSGDDYHYLVRVRRLGAGEFFDAFLPGGGTCRVRIVSTGRGILGGECTRIGANVPASEGGYGAEEHRVVRELVSGPSPFPSIILLQALPKGSKMDRIVREAAESGVSELLPFVSEFSVPRLKGNEGNAKLNRWKRIIREARQQSGSPVETLIRAPEDFGEVLAWWEELKNTRAQARGILFHQVPLAPQPSPKPSAQERRQGVLEASLHDSPLEKGSLHGYLEDRPDPVVLAIGPEGGFSQGEAEAFMAAGFRPISIGNSVLRVETAALYGIAAATIILLERDSWTLKG
ncbi:MAG: 16S rRNA (uracil(1498)-N(3))-methyltransferase [Treponema sp.]|jgi:16S rRNA (uracil1498-N3)-methyltransferase|nr:16S rRNA (uracil(1498)-N(3))-methyltransferase [Treponema sp.]